MSSDNQPGSPGTTKEPSQNATPRYEQPLTDAEVMTMLKTASNRDRIMPIVSGNWQASTRTYQSCEDAARALIFDLSFYTNYRFSQVERLFNQTGVSNVFTKEQINDIVEEAYFEQGGRSYPTFK